MLLVLFSSDSCWNRDRGNALHAADRVVGDGVLFSDSCLNRGRENVSHAADGDAGDGIVINVVKMSSKCYSKQRMIRPNEKVLRLTV